MSTAAWAGGTVQGGPACSAGTMHMSGPVCIPTTGRGREHRGAANMQLMGGLLVYLHRCLLFPSKAGYLRRRAA
jgi:hypothetical protein